MPKKKGWKTVDLPSARRQEPDRFLGSNVNRNSRQNSQKPNKNQTQRVPGTNGPNRTVAGKRGPQAQPNRPNGGAPLSNPAQPSATTPRSLTSGRTLSNDHSKLLPFAFDEQVVDTTTGSRRLLIAVDKAAKAALAAAIPTLDDAQSEDVKFGNGNFHYWQYSIPVEALMHADLREPPWG